MNLIRIKATMNVVAFLFLILLLGCQLAGSNAFAAETGIKSQQKNTTEPETDPSHSLYLSIEDKFGVPSTQTQEIFDCTDKIYTVLELENHPLGKHQLSVRWIDPNGTVREHTQYDFHIRIQKTRLWAWLSLTRGFGSGMLKWANPAAGLEEFIGLWEIDVRVDGKRIGKENFEVSC